MRLGDYKLAKKGFLRSADLNKKFYGEDHPEYAKTIFN
jgi:hypothetical protein